MLSTLSRYHRNTALCNSTLRFIQRHAVAKVEPPKDTTLNKPRKQYTKEERIEQWDYVNSVYFGPERDVKNFPNLVQPDSRPPVRMLIFPATWFEFMYPKTGVSGPYLLLGGFAVWMLSKEIMVIDHYFWEFPSFWAAVTIVCHQFGDKIRQAVDEKLKLKEEILYTRPLKFMKAGEEKNVKQFERMIEETEAAKHIYQAKKEGVELQLETAYRQRLLSAYQDVKKRLDFEVEKAKLKRKFEQDHMANWIVANVIKSITPRQEKESIDSCIRTLKKLAAKSK